MEKLTQGRRTSTEELVAYIKQEHLRWRKQIGVIDEYDSETTIGIGEVLNAHFLLAEFFARTGEGLGGLGPKDLGLLHSALNRQFVQFGGVPKWSNRIQICASLMFGLIKNHPFHDANKRTAFLTSILHLQKIGRTPTVDQKVYEDFTVDIADNNLQKYDRSMDEKNPDKEIIIISNFLRRHTREIDLNLKQITYRELDRILHGYGMMIKNPKGNRIDLIKFKDPITKLDIKETRLAHIGFHGWTKQISKKDLHIVRNASKLDVEHGYDSQSFFNGVESPLSLINRYREPLQNLAYR